MVCSALLSRHAACPFPCQPSNAGTSGRVHTGKPAQLRARTLRVSAGSDHEFSRRDVGLLLSGALCLSADKASAGGPDEEGRVALATEREVQNFSKYQQQVMEFNKRVQFQNKSPKDFPTFVRDQFNIDIVAPGYTEDADGLVYKDFKVGDGPLPEDGQQVTFAYTAYNESGNLIDSTYRQGRNAESQLGVRGMIPGFELGLKGMRPGGQRRIVVPPALGPPVGPQTFFSAKQCEVFDVELFEIKTCRREGALMFSRNVCE